MEKIVIEERGNSTKLEWYYRQEERERSAKNKREWKKEKRNWETELCDSQMGI